MTDQQGTMRLYMITDDKGRTPGDLADRVKRGVAGGATAVQFREKNCGPTLCSRAFEAVAAICAEFNVPLYLNADLMGRFDISAPFTGFQYSDRTLPPHPSPLARTVGYSAHGPDDAVTAFSHAVDFCTLSPIYATPSKAGILNPIGLDAIRKTRKLLPDKTIVALGGIDETNAGKCIRAGASGIAVIRAIIAADDPEAAAARLLRIVENSLHS